MAEVATNNPPVPPGGCWSGRMLGIDYDHLPHWVVDYGCYSLTLHCRGSLPGQALRKLKEINRALQETPPQSSEAERLHRISFKTLESYLDTPTPEAPLSSEHVRRELHGFLSGPTNELAARHWAIMPNHLHLITDPLRFESVHAFKELIRRFKIRTTHCVNQSAKRKGALWQSSAYDRWIRNEQEWRRWHTYVNQNPVKAGLVEDPRQWTGLR